MTQNTQQQSQKAALAFSRILAHIAAYVDQVNQDVDNPEERDTMPNTLAELSLAFEQKGGFRFAKEQALPLAYVFELVHQACNNLAKQAQNVAGQAENQASHTFLWAAKQAAAMRDVLEQKHKEAEGGLIGFDGEMQTKLIQSLGGTGRLEENKTTQSIEGDTDV